MYLQNFKKSDIFFMTDDYQVLEYALGKRKSRAWGCGATAWVRRGTSGAG